MALIFAPDAGAATVTVTTAADEAENSAPNGNCTLREAIRATRLNSAQDTCVAGQTSLDTIVFANAIGNPTISLVSTNEDLNANGDFDIDTTNGPLTIDGGGTITVSGGGVDRVFDLRAGANTFQLEDLTVSNGIPANLTSGGGLRTQAGTTAMLLDAKIDTNGANNITAGGGIQSLGTLTIDGGRVFGNNISGGGTSTGAGISASGTLTITDAEVSFNTGAAGSSRGGGIATSGDTTISDSTIASNTTSDSGGGISYTGTGTLDLDRVELDNNVVIEGGNPGGGGGLAATGASTVTVDDSTITDNSVGLVGPGAADNVGGTGGGIDLSGSGAGTQLTINDSLVDNNEATTRGGGVALSNTSSMTMRRTAVTRNDVVDFPGTSQGTIGGGIGKAGSGSAAYEDVEITSNTVTAETGQAGNAGGVRVGGGDNLNRVTVAFNSMIGGSQQGAGIHSFGGPVSIANTTITQNSAPEATAAGGGLFVTNVTGAISVVNTTITSNTVGGTGRGFNRAAGGSSSLSLAASIVTDGCVGTFTDGGGNRDIAAMAEDCGFTSAGSAPQPIADNGGSTDIGPLLDRRPLRTQAISFANGLVDQANSPCDTAVDARGLERPAEAGCDPGAYELTNCDGTTVGATSIVGTPGDDTLTGTASGEVIVAQSGADTVNGAAGNDRICGGPGDDILNGQGDPDRIDPGPGADTVSGDTGPSDHVTYLEAPAGVTVDLGAGTAATGPNGQDTLSGIEDMTGSRFDDVLTGSSVGNIITAGTVAGSTGDDDVLAGGSGPGPDGPDLFFGGSDPSSVDTITYAGRTDDLNINLTADPGSGPDGDTLNSIENAIGGSGADQIFGSSGPNELTGGPGADLVNAGDGADTIGVRDGVADTVSCGADNGNPDVDVVTADQQGVDAISQCQVPPDVIDFTPPPVIPPPTTNPAQTPVQTPVQTPATPTKAKKCKKGQKRKVVKGKVKCIKKKRRK